MSWRKLYASAPRITASAMPMIEPAAARLKCGDSGGAVSLARSHAASKDSSAGGGMYGRSEAPERACGRNGRRNVSAEAWASSRDGDGSGAAGATGCEVAKLGRGAFSAESVTDAEDCESAVLFRNAELAWA